MSNQIIERLKNWRDVRLITTESQKNGFFKNIKEEIEEFSEAKNDYDKIDALCDIIIISINALDYENEKSILKEVSDRIEDEKRLKISMCNIRNVMNLSLLTIGDDDIVSFDGIPEIISNCKDMIEILGFDFYKCMDETIKELEDRKGSMNSSNTKWIKEPCAYDVNHLIEKYRVELSEFDRLGMILSFINDSRDDVISEIDSYYSKEDNAWVFTDSSLVTEKTFKVHKVYKAKYELCKI